MGKTLILTSILLILSSIAYPFLSGMGLLTVMDKFIISETSPLPVGASCNPDEHLEQRIGPAIRKPGTNFYYRYLEYICQDRHGISRNITNEVTLDAAIENLSAKKHFLNEMLIVAAILVPGIILLVSGLILYFKNRR